MGMVSVDGDNEFTSEAKQISQYGMKYGEKAQEKMMTILWGTR